MLRCRTAFATLGIAGVTAGWELVHGLAVLLMLLLMCLAAYVGIYRYYRIARIVSLKDIPESFGKNRVKVWPVPAVVALSLATVTLSMLAQGFEK